MKTLREFVDEGLTVINDMKERRESYADLIRNYTSVVFSKSTVASVIYNNNELYYSVAVCDYNGYFNWNFFDDSPFKTDKGSVICKNEFEVCLILSWIENK